MNNRFIKLISLFLNTFWTSLLRRRESFEPPDRLAGTQSASAALENGNRCRK